MFQKTVFALSMFAAAAFSGVAVAAADEPTLPQVYQAADAGKLGEAQAMMDKVLANHPNSAKAHFVEAEILAKQGRMDSADSELRTAQRLEPGLPFAKPQAVENLKAHIAAAHNNVQSTQATRAAQPAAASETPWGLIFFVVLLIAAIVFFIRAMNRRNAQVIPAGYGYGPGGMQPMGAGMAPPMGPMGGTMGGGGIGSGIVGGLATGAAIGAGMVAGEALMHHFTDGDRAAGHTTPPAGGQDVLPNDMGGSDFGVSDGGSWDDSSGGGGSDWG